MAAVAAQLSRAEQREVSMGGESDADELNESRCPLEDSGCTRSDDSEASEEDLEDSVVEDMRKLEKSFEGFSQSYRLINRIGEGTFSTVYKAQDLAYGRFRNDWDFEEKENVITTVSPSGRKHRTRRKREHFVAIKKIYVTSSPQRIMNELDLLHDLRDCESIAPLITAFRDKDQVIAILPYFRHLDFRAYFRDLNVADMRIYFRSLFTALAAVHRHGILHRDIKPTNFLYDNTRKRGVLVDFGLAEREGTDYQPCLCEQTNDVRRQKISQCYYNTHERVDGYPKGDQRPSLRANRAGTRGFRAPEVLFKCTAQTTKIDIWSAGIILLTIVCKRFPFFNSSDDIDAVIELTTIFGKAKMRKCALIHGQVLDTNIPSLSEGGHKLENIVVWSTDRPARDKHGDRTQLKPDEKEAVAFLQTLLELDPKHRPTAEESLQHPFLSEEGDSQDEMDVLQLSSSQ